jgi:hypothetical protein
MLKNAGVFSSPDAQPVAELLANPVCYVILSPHWTFRLFCPVLLAVREIDKYD